MTDQNLEWRDYLDFAGRLADAAAEVTGVYFRTPLEVSDKTAPDGQDGFDPVTEADRRVEAVVRDLIQQTYPDHGILGEEQPPKAGDSRYCWVIDPIDGTRAFISGVPTWGTLIALHDGERPIIGVMDQPFTGERFIGSPDGAELNGKSLSVRRCADLSDATMYTTDPDMFETKDQIEAFGALEKRVRLRRFGGDCYAYCMLALGLVDLVVEGDLEPYDIQALIPIIEGAGGIVTAWDGGPAENGGLVIAAGDRRVHAQALEILGRC